MTPKTPACDKAATVSDCELYRYTLTRRWEKGGRTVVFVMLNPSTADADKDDPTIRRCVGFAREWGYQALTVVNLYAYRATKPEDLFDQPEAVRVGPDNNRHLVEACQAADLVVLAWSAETRARSRAIAVAALLGGAGIADLHCLGTTFNGMPRHPLYVLAATQPQPFSKTAREF